MREQGGKGLWGAGIQPGVGDKGIFHVACEEAQNVDLHPINWCVAMGPWYMYSKGGTVSRMNAAWW